MFRHYVVIDVNIAVIFKSKTFLGAGDWRCINDIYL